MKSPKVLFVDPHWRKYNSLQVPFMGILFLSKVAKNMSCEVVGLLDFYTKSPENYNEFLNYEQDFANEVVTTSEREKCDLICVTVTAGVHHRILQIIDLVTSQLPDTTLALGGAAITLSKISDKFQHTYIKYAKDDLKIANPKIIEISGEGEQPLKDILTVIKTGQGDFANIPGVSGVANGEIFSNESQRPNAEILIPDYSLFDHSKYYSAMPTASRGCTGGCTFCDERRLFSGLRNSDLQRVIQELSIIKSLGVKCVKFTDSTLTPNQDRLIHLSKLIIQNKIGIKWIAFGRVAELLKISNNTLNLMRDAGCVGIHVGFETCDSLILRKVNKGYNSPDAIDVVKKIKQAGISVIGSFQLGLGVKNKQDLEIGINGILELDISLYNIHTPFPPVYQLSNPEKFGINQNITHWMNDVSIPGELWNGYIDWHKNKYGFEPSHGRHSASTQFLATGKVLSLRLPYETNGITNEDYSHYISKAMDGREQTEANFMKTNGWI